eukprot:3139550-Prymnesium_polylepis.1
MPAALQRGLEWTRCLTEYLADLRAEAKTAPEKAWPRWDYTTRLLRWQLEEGLLNHPVYLQWLVDQARRAPAVATCKRRVTTPPRPQAQAQAVLSAPNRNE